MSYSFNVRAASKADAVAALGPKFDEVVTAQPVHAKDKEAAISAATTFIGMVEEPTEGHELSVGVHGSLGWRHIEGAPEPTEFLHANIGVQVSSLAKTE